MNDTTQAIEINTALCGPKSSKPRIMHATGVLLAPANTAIKPMAASSSNGKGIIFDSAFPSVDPM